MTPRKRWVRVSAGSIIAVGVTLATTNCSTTTDTTGTAGTATTTTTKSAPAAQGTGPSGVDLALTTASSVTLAPGNTGMRTFTISNNGATTQGASILTYVTPFYVNIDRDQPLPDGCSFRLEDPDPTVPEIVRCTIPAGLEQNKEVQLSIPIVVTTRARLVGPVYSMAIVVPAQGSPDKEVNLTDNVRTPALTIIPPSPQVPNVNIMGLYGTADRPALAPGQRKLTTFTYGNVGPNDMTGEVTITFIAPFYVNFDRDRPLPEGCSFHLEDPDPAVPQMVTCKRPALAKDKEDQIQFGLVAVPGGPRGAQNGGALVAPASASDADFDQTDNLARPGAQIISPVP